jgi:hypothetical protein
MRVKVGKAPKIIPMKEVPARFYDPERDGVTFSLLTTWKNCRERARLFLNGWASKRNSLGMVFGGLTHGINQRMYEDVKAGKLTELPSEQYIKKLCREVEAIWKEENPRADAESMQYLEFSMILIEALMPLYFKYWKKDFALLWQRVEAEFKVPIEIEHPYRAGWTVRIDGRPRRGRGYSRRKRSPTLVSVAKENSQISCHTNCKLTSI